MTGKIFMIGQSAGNKLIQLQLQLQLQLQYLAKILAWFVFLSADFWLFWCLFFAVKQIILS